MSEADPPGEPPNGSLSNWASRPPLSPGAARRRLGSELRRIREAVGLNGTEAGAVIERSAATISRFESAKSAANAPRVIDVAALLEFYGRRDPLMVTQEVKDQMEFLATEGKKEQWFEPFKDLATGAMIPDHYIRYVEYEADASAISTYEPDLLPGLLQTRDYARTMAQVYFPNHTPTEHNRFAQFRMTRREVLQARSVAPRLSVLINEVALRRVLGDPAIHRAQLEDLIRNIRQDGSATRVNLIARSVATPAALGGPFVILSFPEDSDEEALVYLETRSGATYLTSRRDLDRFYSYFASLRGVALSVADSCALIESIIDETGR